MNYSRRQLYALGEPLGDSVTRLKPGGRIYGGGGSQPSTPEKTTQTQELPEWAKPYAKETLAKGAALTDINQNPYKEYGGQRIAGFQPLQEQSFKTVGGMDAGPGGFQAGIGQYMSPYMQNVVDIQKREAGRQSGILGQQIAAKAVQSGAFGGSRQALQTTERDRNLAEQMGDIQARGSQAAYDSAANQFRQGITQQSGLAQLQGQMGAQQQQQAQRPLDVAYQDFLNQQNYPYKQLGFMSDMIRGLPLGQQSTSNIYSAPPSLMGQLGGLGMGAYGLSKMGAFAEGGEVKSYAGNEGSVTSQGNKDAIVDDMYSIEGLQAAKEAALNRRDMDTVAAIDERIAQLNAIQAQSASINYGLGSAFDQIPQERQEAMMAGGGIVAFADRGAVDVEEIQREKDRAALAQAYEDFKKGARKTGAAAMDIGTLPFRAIAGAGESVITRPLRALGVDIPYLPESYYGGDASSMTPYMDKLRKEEGYTTGGMDPFYSTQTKTPSSDRPPAKGIGARTTPPFIAKDKPEPKPEPKQKKLSPTIDKAITKMAEEQGVPKEDFMAMYDKVHAKLQSESKEDLKGLQDLIDKQSGKSKEIKEKALGKALAEFGFNMAAQASKTGKESKGQGFPGLLGSASAAAPTLAASFAESEKLAAAADDTDMKLQMEMRKFNIATRKNDSATAMSAAQNMRILQQQQETIKQQQAQLAETSRHNRAVEGLTGARIGASNNAYNTAVMRTKSNIAINAQKQAAKDWADPFKGMELKKQYPSQKSYAQSLYNDMWSQAMPQLELIGTKSAEE
jgi:hypothetical protein